MPNEITTATNMPSVPKLTDRAAGYDQLSQSNFVSIVMPSFNQRRFIGEAIESVLGQSHTHLELIIVDGGSSDGTIELLEMYSSMDSRVRWLSESDKGPADAINKALGMAQGALIGWLNSDDLYTAGAVERASFALDADTNLIMVYGDAFYVDEAGDFIKVYPTLPPTSGISAFKDGCFICQPTVFFKKTMHLLLGPLDTALRTSFDFEYWLRAFKAFPGRCGSIDEVQAFSRLHDGCITSTERELVAVEGVRLVHKYLGKSQLHWFFTYVDEMTEGQETAEDFSKILNSLNGTLDKLVGSLSSDDVALARTVLENMRANSPI